MTSIPPEFDINSYDYPLPEENIAYYPPKERVSSRLLVIERERGNLFFHEKFSELEVYLQEGDLLVLNDTKVFPARIKAVKKTGGIVEILLFNKPKGKSFETQGLVKGKRLKPGMSLSVPDGEIEIHLLEDLRGGRFKLRLETTGDDLERAIESIGKAPLPPYIKREPEDLDLLRYQTVFASKEGSIAAPTAGFHFDPPLLKKLKAKGVEIKFITLHVGYGTFAPIKVRDIRKHKIEPEYVEVSHETVSAIKKAKAQGRRVIGVGTTTARTLEFIAKYGLKPFKGLCDLYIYPGFEFRILSALITNFHLPRSSLLLLVCAFAGRDLILRAYKEAIQRGYRFYSYGDATFII
ncbi:S-adenosylmethionine tRNA ribosyltransferase [Caldimicrobium thiodismutans]|uniref:S-adenosylmethionine:tRNA ribosyltransferase-isomerase n=1 Tax=Caldimicrobium thiodismutans TaxID=1653476 RepID=A0A0U4W471_9BACT|nr:tRNA preQ1(34) S-adenosylmethionine ribosyltransferase-isomerase QueA [Caldimicrobium thiodismutans]BAU23883.1 S-adenosylmethionine tRNA ribosyltransferase [Caldimicrobium thiodismutans]